MTPEERLKLIQSRCTEDGPCWIWLGATDGHGRPQMRHEGRTTYVRRVVRALADGAPVPAKRVVASRCGNKGCVSPECSVVATHKQKAQFGAERGAYTNIKKTVKHFSRQRHPPGRGQARPFKPLRWAGGAGMSAIILPWPSTALSPNARTHWAKLAKTKRLYREACACSAREQGLARIQAEALHLTLTFYAPTR